MPTLDKEIQPRPRHALSTHGVRTNPAASVRGGSLVSTLALAEFQANEKAEATGSVHILGPHYQKRDVRSTLEDEGVAVSRQAQTTSLVLILSVMLSTFMVALVLASFFDVQFGGFVAAFLLIAGLGLGGSTAGFALEAARRRNATS